MKILADVQVELDRVRVRYFSARELLRLRRWGVHAELPDTYLPALLRVAHAADQLRAMHGAPVICGNGYRPIDYNKAAGGSRNSAHIRAAAMDLDPTERADEFAVLCARAWLGTDWLHGLGVYAGRVHIDVDHLGSAGKRAWPGRWNPASKTARVLRRAKALGPITLEDLPNA